MTVSAAESPRPVIASGVEILIYHFILVYVWGLMDPQLESSPRVQEWFDWVPANLGFWLLNACFGLILAPPLTGISLFFVAAACSRRPDWVAWRWTGAGRPVMLGSLLFVSLTYACLWVCLKTLGGQPSA